MGSRREVALTALLLFVVAFVGAGVNPAGKWVIAPMDLLTSYPGFRDGLPPPTEVMGEASDILDSVLPMWRFVKEQVWAGHLPLWNPRPSGGEPVASIIFHGFVSPRFLLFLLLPEALGYTLGIVVQFLVAGLGMFLLCRSRLGWWPSLFGGVTFMFCGFNATWTQWVHVSTSCWLPWMLWALLRLFSVPTGARAAVLGLTVALTLFGGFPSVAGFGFYVAFGLGATVLIHRAWVARSVVSQLKPLMLTLAGVGLGAALAAVQLLPSIDSLLHLDLSYRERSHGLNLASLHLLWDPFADGLPRVEVTSYVGLLPLALIATLAALAAARRTPKPWPEGFSPVFWSSAMALTLIAIFGFPGPLASLLYRLPVLFTNPAGRMTSIFGLEAAVLTAMSLEALSPWARRVAVPRWAGQAVLTAVLVAHAADLSRLVRAHNTRVEPARFYAELPMLTRVRLNLLPGQSALAMSDTFLLPGTLGAYGINEWFAHAYRSDAEKKVLATVARDPWVTATAAVLSFDKLDLSSPWLDLFSVRYLLMRPPASVAQMRHDTPLPLDADGVEQQFTLDQASAVTKVSLLLATYRLPHAETDVKLTLSTPENQKLASTTLAGQLITDNQWATFRFDPPVELPRGEYRLRAEAVNLGTSSRVALWAALGEDTYVPGFIVKNDQRSPGDVCFEVATATVSAGPFLPVSLTEQVAAFERPNTPPGALFLSTEDWGVPPAQAHPWWSGIEALKGTPDHLVQEVSVSQPARLVSSQRAGRGWTVTVDGASAEKESYQGVLPAVRLEPGHHTVEWSYRPPGWSLAIAISACAAAVCVALVALGRRRELGSAARG